MREKNRDQQNDQGLADQTKIYPTPDSTLQTQGEHKHDQPVGPAKDRTIDVSNVDLHKTRADRLAGSDRAGTAERKDSAIDSNG